MKLDSKVIATVMALVFMGCVLAVVATANGSSKVPSESVASNSKKEALTEDTGNLTVEAAGVDKVGISDDETEVDVFDADATEVPVIEEQVKEPELSEEEFAWKDNMVPNVEKTLNVRAEANGESKLVGKLKKADLAVVLEKGTEWSKIKSGNLEGYVSNEYCLFGTDALNYVKANCKTVATTTTDGLRIRAEKSTDSKVIKRLDKGTKVEVDTTVELDGEWIPVIYNSKKGFISAEFATISYDTGVGQTMEELAEIKKKEEAEKEAKRKAEEAKKAANNRTKNKEYAASVSEEDLLAAIIYCEAGGESYEAQLGVGSVVMNRVRSSRYPNNIVDVVYQKGQFTPAASGKLNRVLKSKRASASCYRAAREALSGVDNVNGATGFRLASTGRKGIVIGRIVFLQ